MPAIKKSGFNIDSASNGIMLPKKYHDGYHSAYNNAMRQYLDRLHVKYRPYKAAQKGKLQKELTDFVDHIKDSLKKGEPKLYVNGKPSKSDAQALEAWQRLINRFEASQ